MPTIENKTRTPLVIALPGGKKLRLGPLKRAEITAKSVAHPPIQKLLEAEKVAIHGAEKKSRNLGATGKGAGPAPGGHSAGGAIRKTGDR